MTLPATRSLYTHAGGQIPWASHPGGNDNRAMRIFSWSKLLAVQFAVTNNDRPVTIPLDDKAGGFGIEVGWAAAQGDKAEL